MELFCVIVCPVIFLGLGAILDKGVQLLKEHIPARLKVLTITALLGIIAYINLDINQIDVWHSNKSSLWKRNNVAAIIDKIVADKLPSKEWVVFNGGGNNAIMMMFYTGATAYGCYPTAGQYQTLKAKGIKMATLADENIPGYLKQDPLVKKFYIKPVCY